MLPEPLAQHPRRRELDVLVACARVTLDAESGSRIAAALAAGVEWAPLLHLAHGHGVLPLLQHHLKATAADGVPAAVRAELAERLAASAQRSLLLTATLAEVLRALAAAGIGAVTFKGPLLAASLYGNLGLRPFRDVDVLVRPQSLVAAVERLVREGYLVAPGQGEVASRLRCAWVSDLTLTRGASVVELHWKLTAPYFGLTDGLDDLADSLVPAEVGGTAVRTLSPTELLFYLCVHGATHRWCRLGWICDVAEMLRRAAPVDWERMRRRAAAAGAIRMVALGLHLADSLLGAPLPDSPLAEEAHSAPVRSLAARVYAALPDELPDPNPGLKLSPFHLAMRERLRDRLRYAAAVLLAPSPLDVVALPLPPRLFPLYYVIRPLRLAASHVRRLALAAARPAPHG